MSHVEIVLLFLLPFPALFGCSPGKEEHGTEEPPPCREVSFPSADGGTVFADLYGEGDHGVVLAHGAVFDKASWAPLARRLAAEGFRVLAIDFRGYGKSTPGTKGTQALEEDLLGSIRYLREQGVSRVSMIGGSMGGGAAAKAACAVKEGEIHALILLSPVPVPHPEAVKAERVLVAASKDERLAPRIRAQFEKIRAPKELKLLEGNAHAQHIFKTDRGAALTRLIVEELRKP